MALGAEHVEATRLDDALAELDVDAAAGHVRRDRDRARLARVLDDLALALVLLRVQHVVRIPRRLRSSERYSDVSTAIVPTSTADRARALDDVLEHGVPLRVLRLEDEVALVGARDWDVGRDLDDVQVVDLDELLLLRLRRAGHARASRTGQFCSVIVASVTFSSRIATPSFASIAWWSLLAPAAPLHDPAGVLVDDLHLAVLHDVVDVALVERLGLERLGEMVDELDVPWVVQVVDPERCVDLVERRLQVRRS